MTSINELEVKILEINKESIIRTLETYGAVKIFEGDLYSRHYANSNGKIRIRKAGDMVYITKKTAFVYHDIKHALELETYIGDFDTFCHMLDLLGFKMVKEIHKHRVSYILEDIHYDIDMWWDIPTFIEVEGQSEETVVRWVKLLWYTMKDSVAYGSDELWDIYHPKVIK